MLEEIVMFTRGFSKDYFRQKWEYNLSLGMRKILTTLSPIEEKTMRMLHGIQERKKYSIKEIAVEFNTTQKDIKSLIDAANTKLREYSILEIMEH